MKGEEMKKDCNGKCTYCGNTGFRNMSSGKEVKIGYSYSFKVDFNGDRYIKAEEVKELLECERKKVIEKFDRFMKNFPSLLCNLTVMEEWEKFKEQLKDQNIK